MAWRAGWWPAGRLLHTPNIHIYICVCVCVPVWYQRENYSMTSKGRKKHLNMKFSMKRQMFRTCAYCIYGRYSMHTVSIEDTACILYLWKIQYACCIYRRYSMHTVSMEDTACILYLWKIQHAYCIYGRYSMHKFAYTICNTNTYNVQYVI